MLPFLQFFAGLIIAIGSFPYAIYLIEETPFDYEGNAILANIAGIGTLVGMMIFMTA